MTTTQTASSRRSLFRQAPPVQRPPWTDEARVAAECTSCGECLKACPEAILIAGPGRTPAVDFTRNPCTFCGACAEACPEDVFRPRDTAPWSLTAAIGASCLMASGVECRTCTDVCDTSALRFRRVVGGGAIVVTDDDCTGCGACLGVCPTGAISLIETSPKETLR